MPYTLSSDRVAEIIYSACLLELQALKPGNVGFDRPAHRMTAADFVTSADCIAPQLARPDRSVGENILAAIQATHAAVGSNTILGIVLLAAPLAKAAMLGPLLDTIPAVLSSLTVKDAQQAFQAICLASPAGLGEETDNDVRQVPQITLLAAMQQSAARDRIAFQYAHPYTDILHIGLPCLTRTLAAGQAMKNAVTAVYMAYLSNLPDSHIVRKQGLEVAQQVQHEAQQLVIDGKYDHLQQWDKQLKDQGINPGTSADLTVTTLTVAQMLQTECVHQWSFPDEVNRDSIIISGHENARYFNC